MEKIRIVLVKPGEPAAIKTVDHDLATMQALVGGLIEATHPFEDPVALVCDDKAFLKRHPLNRYINEDLIISGTFFICGLTEDNFGSLSTDLAKKYLERFGDPEYFVRINNHLWCVRNKQGKNNVVAMINI